MTSTWEKWPISHVINMYFPKIRMAMVFGDSGNSCLFVTEDQMVYGIGNNSEGCLGTGDSKNALRPRKINELCEQNIKTFACGTAHGLALTKNGEVYSWGKDESWQLGYPCENSVSTHVLIMEGVSDIACGANHSVVLTNDGLVYTWGDNTVNRGTEYVKLNTNNLIKCASICCGGSHSMAVMNNGEVYSWGSNSVGQLGNGTTNDVSFSNPSKVVNLNGIAIVKVVCGMKHTLALSDQGLLYSWGNNEFGQLGFLEVEKHSSPILIPRRVSDIAASNSSNISIAMAEGIEFYIWGNCFGQNLNAPARITVDTMHDVFAIFALPNVMHQPLVIGDDDKDDEAEKETTCVVDNLETAFDDKNISDLTIEVEGKPIYVHKSILKIQSEYFKKMFGGSWKEDSVVKVNQFCYVVYRAFLKFLYTGKIDIPAENAVELLQLADFCINDHLKRKLVDVIMRGISTDNAAFIYSAAVKYGTMELKELSIQFAVKNMTSVVESTSFAELSPEVVKTFVTEANKFKVFNT